MTKPNENTPVLKSSNSKTNEQKHETVVQLALAKSTNKFCCVHCQKTLCLKPECTGFDKKLYRRPNQI